MRLSAYKNLQISRQPEGGGGTHLKYGILSFVLRDRRLAEGPAASETLELLIIGSEGDSYAKKGLGNAGSKANSALSADSCAFAGSDRLPMANAESPLRTLLNGHSKTEPTVVERS